MPQPLIGHLVGRPRLGFGTFGVLERRGSPSVWLLDGYRDLVKRRWRANWWPVTTLLVLAADEAVALPPDLDGLAAKILVSRTLPVEPERVAESLAELFETHPDHFSKPSRFDSRYRMEVLEPALTRDPQVETYRQGATAIRELADASGIGFRKARVLDVGCASGFHAFALGALAGEVVGIDLDVESYVPPAQRRRARELLLPLEDDHRVRLEEGDVTALDYPDESFDVVVSNTVLEHVRDLPAAFRETRRVLRPGGIAFHGVQPWFGPEGGHGLCTLDFPWGHVRLDDAEFAAYAHAWRPLEAADAIAYHSRGFQQPRLTLDQSRSAARDAGFEILEWNETRVPLRDVHSGLVTDELVADCRRHRPEITKRDLLTVGYSTLLRRR